MSVGQKHPHKLTSSELDDLLDEALAVPKIKARLVAPFFKTVVGTDRYVDQLW